MHPDTPSGYVFHLCSTACPDSYWQRTTAGSNPAVATFSVQLWCRFKTALTRSMFAGQAGGSNNLAPILAFGQFWPKAKIEQASR
jgi:hypothetical protein